MMERLLPWHRWLDWTIVGLVAFVIVTFMAGSLTGASTGALIWIIGALDCVAADMTTREIHRPDIDELQALKESNGIGI